MIDESTAVVIQQPGAQYPTLAPFHPSELYPEYPFKTYLNRVPNPVYDSVRRCFQKLELDPERFGRPDWNPLGEILSPGKKVVIKPNWVQHYHDAGEDIFSVITHGSVIRAVLDYAYLALKGSGTIILGDAPLQKSEFQTILRMCGIEEIVEFYRSFARLEIRVVDFRRQMSQKDAFGVVKSRQVQDGDPDGYVTVNLGEGSLFRKKNGKTQRYGSEYFERFRVTNYDAMEMPKHHNNQKDEYLISKSILDADLLINIPKLKTHRKAGLTCALKNLVGINGDKDWLPHYSWGSAEEGGDEYQFKDPRKAMFFKLTEAIERQGPIMKKRILSVFRKAIKISGVIVPFKDPFFEGSWYGNDTLWRMILDINVAFFYANTKGVIENQRQREMLVIVDAIIAGEGEGPLEPTPKPCGLIVGGSNPVTIDTVAAAIMGFDPLNIPLLVRAQEASRSLVHPATPIQIISNNPSWRGDLSALKKYNMGFTSAKGWSLPQCPLKNV